jgi:hypothetical protein
MVVPPHPPPVVTRSHEENPMSLRRAASLVLVLALAACKSATQEPQPAELVFATFASPVIPTPNDLALAQVPAVPSCTLMPDGQAQLLCSFVKAGGWPSDQEVSISLPFNSIRWDASPTASAPYGHYVPSATAPTIDTNTITASTVTVMRVDGPAPVAVAYDAVAAPGVLTLRKQAGANGRRWDPGARYVVAVRGGPRGVKTTTGLPVSADSGVALVIANKDLTNPENQPLGAVPDSNGSGTNSDEVAQLEGLRAATWQPITWSNATGAWAAGAPAAGVTITPAFLAVDAAFPHAETATIATFGTAPDAGPVVLIDAGSGQAPLPIDLLRTSAAGTIDLNPAFGPAAAGLSTLDGFSTTAMVLAQTSVPVAAATVMGDNVYLYKLSGGTPVLVKELKRELGHAQGGDPTANPAAAGYVAEPSAIIIAAGSGGCPAAVTGGCSPAIGLQPAVYAPVSASVAFNLPPLDEETLYGVVVTDRVTDAAGRAFTRSTVARIVLEFTHIMKADAVTSDLPGIGNATAKALSDMQGALAPLWAPGVLPAGTTKANVATAYTFKTQSITQTSTLLAALPYKLDSAIFAATNTVAISPVALTNIPFAALPGVTTTGVNAIYDVTFMSIDAIDKSTGALNPAIANPATLPGLLTPLHALVVVPQPGNPLIAACPAGYPAGLKCPKLVVFGHGLNGSKETLLTNAATLASAGFIAAAIDFPLHGGRNWCSADADCVTAAGAAGPAGSCDKGGAFAASAGQGDTVRPGVCVGGTSPTVFSAPGVNVGSRYFISANFFRARDALRQNVLDVSALTLALNRPPPPYPQPAANQLRDALGLLGLAVDPTTSYYEGISLGSIGGTLAVAANPRLSRALFSVGGGTLVSIFTNAPAFHTSVEVLFKSLNPAFSWNAVDPANAAFDPAVAAWYLQMVNVATWILDPGDPINYAGKLITPGAGMANFLADPTLATPQPPKQVQAQVATGDLVVPNATNWLLYGLMSAPTSLYVSDSAFGGAVPHSMLGTIASVQADAAGYLVTGTNTPATIHLP